MLVSAAAKESGVPESELNTEKSTIIHAPTGRRLKYGALAEKAAALPVPDEKTIPPKARKDYTLIGTRVMGVDVPKIAIGQPLYGIDQVQPGMVYATYTKCPAVGGKVAKANLDEIKKMPGVKDAFVIEGNGRPSELVPGIAIVAIGRARFAAAGAGRLQCDLHRYWPSHPAAAPDAGKFHGLTDHSDTRPSPPPGRGSEGKALSG